MLATLLELLGFACFTAAAYLIYPVAALVVGGVCLVVIAQAEPALPRFKKVDR